MLFALALLAANAGGVPPPPLDHGVYVADQVPAKVVALDPKKVCKDGYIDPARLAFQLIVQLDLGDDLTGHTVDELKLKFNGTSCRENEGTASGYSKQNGYCTGAIAVQRILLNLYPGFRPYDVALKHYAVDPKDLSRDVTDIGDQAQRTNIADFAQGFLGGKSSDDFVRCDDAPPVWPKPDKPADLPQKPKPPVQVADQGRPTPPPPDREPPPSTAFDQRSSGGHQMTRAASNLADLFGRLQWRQTPGNLIYRSASGDDPDPYYVTGQDLYNADGGFSFSLAHTTTNESTVKGQPKPSSRNYAVNFQGAIGYPIFKKDKLISGEDPPGEKTSYFVNLIPYAAIDRESKKDTATGATDTPPAKFSANRTELGAVGFLYTDKQPHNCFIRKLFPNALDDLQSCASYLVLRMDEVHDSLAHSRLDAAMVRYVPVVKTASKGLGAFDVCINTVCGDPNRILRMGFLADARLDFGDFVSRGDDVDQLPYNKDYTRIGGRVGILGDLSFLPSAPTHFWIAWTDVHPLHGYDHDLSEVQAQASFNFSAATLSLSWRNGRREDTAQRDNTWKVSLGFKSK